MAVDPADLTRDNDDRAAAGCRRLRLCYQRPGRRRRHLGRGPGQRVKAWRRRRGGLSQRALAELAGVSQAYISQIESGHRAVDRKSTQVVIARALDISVAQLLGEANGIDPARDKATIHVPAIRQALVELSAGERRTPTRDRDVLTGLVRQASERRNAADYASVTPNLAALLLDVAGHGTDMAAELIEALFVAQFSLKSLGFPDLARQAAEVGVRVADTIDEQYWRGAAYFSWAQSFPPESADLAVRLVGREAGALETEASQEARETYGRLHLLAALHAAVDNRSSDARSHLDEAADVAAGLGEPQQYGPLSAGVTASWFGPTQVKLWRVSVAAELGDANTALQVAQDVDLALMPVPVRRVYFHMDMARALAAGGEDRRAMHSLALAERSAPQHFRFSPVSRNLVGTLVCRAKHRAVHGEMAVLARRMGIDVV